MTVVPKLIESFHYRPEVDGLRAVAVLAVLLFHADLGLPGGYVGVDVFFVISGYLITSLIVRDVERGEFSMAHFWERRIRRIWPPMVVVVLAVLVAGWFLLLPADFEELGRSAVWQTLCAANVFFWRESGYFAGAAEDKPLLHTWSLAVEEQFYLIIPACLSFLGRFPKWMTRHRLFLVFGLLIAGSLALSVYGVNRAPSATFYLLPTRAWELSLGSLLAIMPTTRLQQSSVARRLLPAVGLACILFACFRFSSATPFPGLAALIPCCGTALIIWSTARPFRGDAAVSADLSNGADAAHPTRPVLVERLLASTPVVGIGLISYSLYLWHWPLFAFHRHIALVPASTGTRFLLMLAAFPLAILSWRFVETPFRQKTILPRRPRLFAVAATGSLAVAGLGLLINHWNGIPHRISEKALALAVYKDDQEFHEEHTLQQIQEGAITRLDTGLNLDRPTVLIWGDSLARATLLAWEKFCRQRALQAGAVTRSATSPVLDYYRLPPRGHGLRERSPDFNSNVLELIRQLAPREVVLIAHWESDEPTADHGGARPFVEALKQTVRSLHDCGSRVWIMLQVPGHPVEVPRALMYRELYGFDVTTVSARPNQWNGLHGEGELLLKEFRDLGVGVLDPRPLFLDADAGVYRMELNGLPLYVDRGHLSPAGARMLVAPWLERVLPSNFGRPQETSGR